MKLSPSIEALIEGFMARCDDQQILLPISDWKKGEKARLVTGPFSDFVGHVPTFLTDEEIKTIDKEIKEIINACAEYAKDSPEVSEEELWTDIYA